MDTKHTKKRQRTVVARNHKPIKTFKNQAKSSKQERISDIVFLAVKSSQSAGIREAEILKKLKPTDKSEEHKILFSLNSLLNNQKLLFNDGRYYDIAFFPPQHAVITRLIRNNAFATIDDGSEVYIPNRLLRSGLPNDEALIRIISKGNTSSLPTAEVIKLLDEPSDYTFMGIADYSQGLCMVRPDNYIHYGLLLDYKKDEKPKQGDKIICTIIRSSHKKGKPVATIVSNYGKSDNPYNCAKAILDMKGIRQEFPKRVLSQALMLEAKGISEEEKSSRLDLRNELIFTIDSAESKDLDDAVSIKKDGENYILGVHIADVSHYVTLNSPLDNEAYERGTSIYFADRVIPMLPKELSNGICSLNPNEDRLSLSCIMVVAPDGKILSYDFKKSIINSKVKGVYKEINKIIENTADDEIIKKYDGLIPSIMLMKELKDILTDAKAKRGAPEIITVESKIIFNEKGEVSDIEPRTRGISEVIIEEFMLLANEAAASFARENELPFIFRVHEPPTPQKIQALKDSLESLGINTVSIKDSVNAKVLANLLADNKDAKFFPTLNQIVLRSMSKARYFEKPLGHFGLCLENYAQFTSPIRRYPDLCIHRIISGFLEGTQKEKIQARFSKIVPDASKQSSDTELVAMLIERDCDDCYKASYIKNHIGEIFEGNISSLANHGIYVMLDNSVEGLIRNADLPLGDYDFSNPTKIIERRTNKIYSVGDRVKIICEKADVNSGKIDFKFYED